MARFRNYILNNFWLKVFSCIMAVMIWFAVQSNLTTGSPFSQNPFNPWETHEFNRPVAIATEAGHQQILNVTPTEARVSLRGSKTFFKALKPSDIQVYVDLTDVTEVHGAYPLKVNAPRQGLNRIEVDPAYAHVEPNKGTK